MSVNEHTGEQQKTKAATEDYREGYDKIFKKEVLKKPVKEEDIEDCGSACACLNRR